MPDEKTIVPPSEEGDEKERKIDEEDEMVEEHLSKIYKALGDMTEAVKELANFVKASSEVSRGLEETLKGINSRLDSFEKAITVGVQQAASEHRKQDKFKTSGSPEAVGETVNIPAAGVREPGAEMLEKGIADIKKAVAVVSSPRPGGIKNESVGSNKLADVVKDIMAGKVRFGDVPRILKEVV